MKLEPAESAVTESVLVIDTATAVCSVALMAGDQCFERAYKRPGGHSQIVLKIINEVLDEAGLAIHDLDGIAVDVGPGSFTGLRIGMGIAQGLAYGKGLPCFGYCSLQALAFAAVQHGYRGEVLVCMDARMNQVYCARYVVDQSLIKMIDPPRVVSPQVLCDEIMAPADASGEAVTLGIGDGFRIHAEVLERCVKQTRNDSPGAVLGLGLLRGGWLQASDPLTLPAIYVRNDVVQQVAG